MCWHVYPLNDLIEHETERTDGECPCDPQVEWIDPETDLPYADGPLVIHNPIDVRGCIERCRQREEKPWAHRSA